MSLKSLLKGSLQGLTEATERHLERVLRATDESIGQLNATDQEYVYGNKEELCCKNVPSSLRERLRAFATAEHEQLREDVVEINK